MNRSTDEAMLKAIAWQFRQPGGKYAVQVGQKMKQEWQKAII